MDDAELLGAIHIKQESFRRISSHWSWKIIVLTDAGSFEFLYARYLRERFSGNFKPCQFTLPLQSSSLGFRTAGSLLQSTSDHFATRSTWYRVEKPYASCEPFMFREPHFDETLQLIFCNARLLPYHISSGILSTSPAYVSVWYL